MASLAAAASSRARAGRRHRSPRRPASPARLRIALFADGARQPRWLVDALAAVAGADFAEIVLVAVRDGQAARLPWFWQGYRQADARLFGASAPPSADPTAPTDLHEAAPRAPWLVYGPPPAGQLPAWRTALAGLPPLDVVFAVGDLDDGEFEDLARYGVWRYCCGPAHEPHMGLAGLTEVTRGDPVTHTGLRVRLWPGVQRLIYASKSRTHPYSASRNQAALFRKTARFAERELRRLHRLGGARLRIPGEALGASGPTAPAPRPALAELARFGGRLLRTGWDKLWHGEMWHPAFRFGPPDGPGGDELPAYTPLLPPPDQVWSAPFPYQRNGRHFVFCAEQPRDRGPGRIVALEVFADGAHTEPRRILEQDYDLGHPSLVEHEGHLYLVAESRARRRVELYRCRRFPDLWDLERPLLEDQDWSAATLYRDPDPAGEWWMFVTLGGGEAGPDDELHLFHARDLSGPQARWLPHPDNPVKSDVCSAHPAGRLFTRGGRLYRPARIDAPRVGTGIAFAQVRELSPLAYREEVAECLLPPPGRPIVGLGSLNRAGDLNVIDCLSRHSRL